MNISLIDLLNDLDALIATLGEPRAFDSDYAEITHEAEQLYSEVHAAVHGPEGTSLDQLRRWRVQLVALASRVAQYPGADAVTEQYVLVGTVVGTAVPTDVDDVDDAGDWLREKVAGDAKYHGTTDLDQLAGTSLPGDPVSEPDPNDLPPRRPKS